jgi:hypothetical protein
MEFITNMTPEKNSVCLVLAGADTGMEWRYVSYICHIFQIDVLAISVRLLQIYLLLHSSNCTRHVGSFAA